MIDAVRTSDARTGERSGSVPAVSYDPLPVPVVVTDAALRAVHMNEAWDSLLTSSSSDGSWLDIFDPAERERVSGHLLSAVENEREMTFEARGSVVGQWFEVRAAQADPPSALVVVVLDVSVHRRREALLAVEASRDWLTGLFNRRTLFDHMSRAIARLERRTSTLSVAFIDVDRFKKINDQYGHTVGDGVLASVAERLRQVTRPSDILARVGGDEFVVVCEDLDRHDSACVAGRRIAEALAEPVRISPSGPIALSASVGVCATSDPNAEPSVLLDKADLAMYEARRRHVIVHQHDEAPGKPSPERRPCPDAPPGALADLSYARRAISAVNWNGRGAGRPGRG